MDLCRGFRAPMLALTAAALALGAGPAAAGDDVPDKDLYTVYKRVDKAFDVDGRVIAAMHFTENTYGPGDTKDFKGPFGFGDNAWSEHRNAYKKGKRPGSYPFRAKKSKYCRKQKRKRPCVMDMFDAAMATGSFLKANGADATLRSHDTKQALCYFNLGRKTAKCDYRKRVIKKARTYDKDRF